MNEYELPKQDIEIGQRIYPFREKGTFRNLNDYRGVSALLHLPEKGERDQVSIKIQLFPIYNLLRMKEHWLKIFPFDREKRNGYQIDARDFDLEARRRKLQTAIENPPNTNRRLALQIDSDDLGTSDRHESNTWKCQVYANGYYTAEASFDKSHLFFDGFYPNDTGPLAYDPESPYTAASYYANELFVGYVHHLGFADRPSQLAEIGVVFFTSGSST